MRIHTTLLSIALAAAGAWLVSPSSAFAAPPAEGGEAGAGASLSTEAGAGARAEADEPTRLSEGREELDWLRRWAPERNMLELGIYGGILLPTRNHELFGPDLSLPEQGFRMLDPIAPDLGVRVGYFPLAWFGVEAEGGVMPTATFDGAGSALLYTGRAHLVGQLGLWSVTPFALIGAGAIGVASDREVLGSDVDPALHFGGGVKVYINRYLMLRFDIRDIVSYKRGVDQVFRAHSPEILVGLSGTLGRKHADPLPQDSDGDGLVDPRDACPNEAETFNEIEDEDGCPERDSDGDGLLDPLDSCPDEAETFNEIEDEDGCPEPDQDGDGILDDQDSCPAEAETVNDYKDGDGCPELDRDDDGLFDENDTCPEEPETDNGYKDEDGCPDEVPKEIQAFTGTIKGITFDNNKDTIRSSSRRTLDKAVNVLTDNPGVRIEITGHTDDKGTREHNLDLSRRRAEAVKAYLVEAGVDESRIETAGQGPDEPIDTNDTREGRANNRRIEFELLERQR